MVISASDLESNDATNILNLLVMSRIWLVLSPFDLFISRYSLTRLLLHKSTGVVFRLLIRASVASSSVLPKGFNFSAQLIAESRSSKGRVTELHPNCVCSAWASRAKRSASALVWKNYRDRLPLLFLRPSTTHFEVAECSYFATRIFEGRIVSSSSFWVSKRQWTVNGSTSFRRSPDASPA